MWWDINFWAEMLENFPSHMATKKIFGDSGMEVNGRGLQKNFENYACQIG